MSKFLLGNIGGILENLEKYGKFVDIRRSLTWGTFREIYRNMGKFGEIRGNLGKFGEICMGMGNFEKFREFLSKYREIWGKLKEI